MYYSTTRHLSLYQNMGKFVIGVQYIDMSAWILQYVWELEKKILEIK